MPKIKIEPILNAKYFKLNMKTNQMIECVNARKELHCDHLEKFLKIYLILFNSICMYIYLCIYSKTIFTFYY